MDTTPEDILIGRVVDRCERPEDWQELERRFAADPELRLQLCSTLRQDATVRQAVAPMLQRADQIELPPLRSPSRLPALAGWLAAATFALLWLTSPGASLQRGRTQPMSAGGADLAAAVGSELGELPPLLVRSHPTDDGKALRVVTMRRILEESVVQQVYRVGEDEFGSPQQVPVALANCTTPSDF